MATAEGVPITAEVEIAPPGPIATAARVFGDAYPPVTGQRAIRVAGVVLLVATALYVPWMLSSLNRSVPWLAWPFAITNLFTLATGLLAVFNSWWRVAPKPRSVPSGSEPAVGVIVTACGEPVPMIMRTVVSVLDQDWPLDRLVLVVSDDGHDPTLQAALEAYPVLYHSPPPRDSPGRDGAAKAGNLNSALAMLDERFPEIRYIETRDADDEMGSQAFLRQVVGQLEANERLAFVQTIKEAQVSAGDPFNNREGIFYRGQMLARNASNAVFPCGSGVVWRRSALRDIGEFPTWNLVEDIQSGVEALRRGWQSMYLPIVGAVGQHSPEDVPNVYKQRGTWAIDTVRLIVWRGLRGMDLRQKAQFLELLFFYLSSFTVLVYVPTLCLALLGWVPLDSNAMGFLTRMLPMVVATEVWLLVLESALQRPSQAPTTEVPCPLARAHNVGGTCPRVHEGLAAGDHQRPQQEACVQGHEKDALSRLALATDVASDDDRPHRHSRRDLRGAVSDPARPDSPRRHRLLGRAQRRALEQLHHAQLARFRASG